MFAVTPLFLAVYRRRILEAVGLGVLAGLVCAVAQQYVAVPFLLLAVLLALVAAAASRLRSRFVGLPWVALVACWGVAGEWLSTFSPIPLNLALTQHRVPWLVSSSAVAGIWGVSLLVWWVNAALADALLAGRGWTCPLRAGVLAIVLALAAGAGFGQAGERGVPLRVAAIQDFEGFPLDSRPEARVQQVQDDLPEREELTRGAAFDGAKLVVWSEGALGAASRPGAANDPTAELARELQVHLVVGFTQLQREGSHNCAGLLTPDGRMPWIHRKIHLFLGERNSMRPGREARAVDTTLGRIGMEICFDTCYTDVTRRLAADGARLVAMPNYDPPSPGAILHHLHAAVLPFRAAEDAVAFVRADPGGFSQVLAPSGRVVAQAPLERATALVVDVPLGSGRGTPYTRMGDWLAYVCTAAVLAPLVRRRRAER